MSADLLGDLLADYIGPACIAIADPTPAKAAKAAKDEHPCGPAPDFESAKALRIPAKAEPGPTDTSPDSQKFAALRSLQTGPQSEKTCGSSQDSQDSQGLPPRSQSQRLAPTARTYRLTRAQADEARADPWDGATIARYQARAAMLQRRGFCADDADDLAERLTLRDRQSDDRRMCLECNHFRPGRCGNHSAAALTAGEVGRDLATMLQNCPGFAS